MKIGQCWTRDRGTHAHTQGRVVVSWKWTSISDTTQGSQQHWTCFSRIYYPVLGC